MIRMVVCDLDGTLLDRRAKIRPQSARLLAQLQREGIWVVLATGRSWRTAYRIQQQTGIAGPLIAHNGAYLFNPQSGQEIYRHCIPAARAREMLEWANHENIMLRCYLGYNKPVIFNRYNTQHQLCWLRPEDRLVTELTSLQEDPLEIFLFGTHDVDAFVHRFGLRDVDYELTIFPHPGYREVNICAPGVDKVEALDVLASKLGVNPSDVLALGDGLNDVAMLKWAGTSIAMGDGTREAQSVASFVTTPGQGEPVVEGVLWALNRGLLAWQMDA